MTRSELADFMDAIFEKKIMRLRSDGQKEYAQSEDNAFANFDRLASDIGLDRKKVLWVFAMKHRDGIASHLNGHTSQREDVTGRIADLIVYLFILWAMIDDERGSKPLPECQSSR